MMNIKPGEHGSTYGGNPLGCKVAMAAMNVLTEEALSENASVAGAYFREAIQKIQSPHIKIIRGKGLLNAIVIDHPEKDAAWKLCNILKDNGLLAKPTHGDIIRLSPPLIIKKEEIDEAVGIIAKSLSGLD
jgi:ornithine--oxo-acid transaminase